MPSPREKHHGGETSTRTSDFTKLESESKEPPGSCTPASPGSSGSPISDDTCPICLGNITDKCMANSCHHCFCLVCLKEWSKQKAVCPLCKESFTTIMYDIKSEKEFKVWKVPRIEPSVSLTNFQEFFVSGRRFFGYRTTNFPGAATLRRQQGGNSPIADAIPSGPRERSSASYRLRGSSFFRINIYINNEWVQPIADITGRYRQSSPELYREQPALTHRLVPWVNRELAALVPPSRIGPVLTEVMDLIERYPINSREFRRAMRPHLGSRTNHFIHEFYHFARSPYDMVGHDHAARYLTRYDFNDVGSSESSSSEDSDAIVEVDVRGNPVSSTFRGSHQSSAAPDNVEREEILTQEGSVMISSDESSSNEIPQQSNLFVQDPSLQQSHETTNPEPYTSATVSMTQLLGRARNFLNSVNEGASTSVGEGSAAARSNAKKPLKREVSSDSDDSDACMIIKEVSKRQPTPEVITLDSEEEKRCGLSSSKDCKYSKRKFVNDSNQRGREPSNSHNHQERKGRKKPCLNRTNFPMSFSHRSGDDPSRQLMRDHSYCNERETEEMLTCDVGGRPNQLSSSKIHQSVDPLRTYKGKQKYHVISSDSETNFQMQQRDKIKHKGKKYKIRKNALRYENSNQGGCGSSSWVDVNSSGRKPRKDHKSKIKNSSQSQNRDSSQQRHSCDQNHFVSETSSNSWCNSDVRTPPSSSLRESSSREGHEQDGSSSECSSSSRNFHSKERNDKHSSSKSKYLNRRGKHKKKDKYKEKTKKEKKRRHKKRYKSRKNVSSSSSDSETSSDRKIKKYKKKRSRIEDSSSLTSSSQSQKSKSRKFRHIEYSTSD